MKRVIKAATDGNVYYWNGVDDVPGYSEIGDVDLIIEDGVTAIKKCLYHHNNIETVKIPSSVTTIRSSAFEYCIYLRSVTIPKSVKTIQYETFRDCTNLSYVVIENGVEEIRYAAFQGCDSLASIVIPESVRYIEDKAFYRCENLVDVKILSKSINIEPTAFAQTPVAKDINKFRQTLSKASFNENTVLDVLANLGIDTTEHKYKIVFCNDRGFGRLRDAESFTAIWPGDFLATWAVSHAYRVGGIDPISYVLDAYETKDEFENAIESIKDLDGGQLMQYYGDADKDLVVSLTNLDTGEVLIDNKSQYNYLVENEPDTFVSY